MSLGFCLHGLTWLLFEEEEEEEAEEERKGGGYLRMKTLVLDSCSHVVVNICDPKTCVTPECILRHTNPFSIK